MWIRNVVNYRLCLYNLFFLFVSFTLRTNSNYLYVTINEINTYCRLILEKCTNCNNSGYFFGNGRILFRKCCESWCFEKYYLKEREMEQNAIIQQQSLIPQDVVHLPRNVNKTIRFHMTSVVMPASNRF